MPAYLPPELWICVAESLYHDYETSLEAIPSKFTPAANFTQSVDFAALRTLASLCRVSKALRHTATPFLYRIPLEKSQRFETLLLRTLATSPELSRHVRELCCSTGPMILSESEMNQASTFLEVVKRNKEFVREHLIAEDGSDDWWDLDEEPLDPHVRDAALIALLPNLVRVSLASPSRHVCFGFEPGSLPKLTSVYVTHNDSYGFLRPHYLKHLAEAASNLTLLHLYLFGTEEMGDDVFPLFPNVTTLMLDTPVIEDVLWSFLLQAFPRLETLSCSWGEGAENKENATIQDIQDAVVECCPRLKTLCVDASYIKTYDDWSDVDRGFDRDLASLQELEHLMTDLTSIGKPKLDENGEETGEVSGICIEALPASLRSLRIFYTEDEDAAELAKSLLDLAAEVHRFPALKEVSIVRSMDPLELDDQVMSAWKNTGAELTLRSPSTLNPSARFWDWL